MLIFIKKSPKNLIPSKRMRREPHSPRENRNDKEGSIPSCMFTYLVLFIDSICNLFTSIKIFLYHLFIQQQ